MRIQINANDRGALLARDLVQIGIPATQARMFAKKFLRLAARPGKLYKKAGKAVGAVHRKKVAETAMLRSGIVGIEGRASKQIAVKKAEGEYVIEAFWTRSGRKPANRKAQRKPNK